MTLLTPKQFPTLRPARVAARRGRGFHVCPVCRLAVEPRNGRAHAKACSRRKRQDPALWQLWMLEMHDYTPLKLRQYLAPGWRVQLVERGLLEQGPLTRRGEWS